MANTSSQWNTSGANVYYNLGNVGIGTSTPSAMLTIAGPATGTPDLFEITPTNTNNFRIDYFGNVYSGIIYPGNANLQLGWDTNVAAAAVSSKGATPLYLTTDAGGSTAEPILLLPAGGGNVGIGTTSPGTNSTSPVQSTLRR